MSKRMSQQKARHEQRRDPADIVLELVRMHAPRPGVEAVHGELQSQWNVLAMFIDVAETMNDAAVLQLECELYSLLLEHTAALALPFRWSIGVRRAGKALGYIGSDAPPEAVCTVCLSSYHWAFRECPTCGSPGANPE